MHKESRSKYNSHLIRLIIALIIFGVAGFFARKVFIPDSMGEYGHYRGADIEDQKSIPIRLGTNDSCFQCHKPVRTIHKSGVHKTVSCEVCHGPYGNHIADGKKIGTMPVKRDQEISQLCLRCHNKVIQARPRKSIRMVGLPEHLEQKQVRMTHTCNQCHMVHDPLMWINQAREMMGLTEVQ
ncbi:hypothetical protein [Desulfopila sp. IMCC35008]|uniref:hypothetical protein n=1 Tax=Desulfopila sp. IMCC35008 TaxID=2653858 RepID=UPI0013D5B8A1|nr:hypothetical protein [Desulfopila sp. IMCC35008]